MNVVAGRELYCAVYVRVALQMLPGISSASTVVSQYPVKVGCGLFIVGTSVERSFQSQVMRITAVPLNSTLFVTFVVCLFWFVTTLAVISVP